MGGTRVARRSLLVAVPVLASAGCTDDSPPQRPPAPDPDVAVLVTALAGVSRLVEAYRATAAAVPTLTAALDPYVAAHDAHAAALRALPQAPAAPARAPASPSPPAGAPRPTARQARARLATLEEQESARTAAECLRASPELARLLASIAGARAAHAALLRRTR